MHCVFQGLKFVRNAGTAPVRVVIQRPPRESPSHDSLRSGQIFQP